MVKIKSIELNVKTGNIEVRIESIKNKAWLFPIDDITDKADFLAQIRIVIGRVLPLKGTKEAWIEKYKNLNSLVGEEL